MVYTLTEVNHGGDSLNELVDAINGRLPSQEDKDRFEHKLVAARYLPLNDYDTPAFKVTNQRAYRIGGGFPRIVRSMLPPGIDHVRYHLGLAAIEPYICDHRLEV